MSGKSQRILSWIFQLAACGANLEPAESSDRWSSSRPAHRSAAKEICRGIHVPNKNIIDPKAFPSPITLLWGKLEAENSLFALLIPYIEGILQQFFQCYRDFHYFLSLDIWSFLFPPDHSGRDAILLVKAKQICLYIFWEHITVFWQMPICHLNCEHHNPIALHCRCSAWVAWKIYAS